LAGPVDLLVGRLVENWKGLGMPQCIVLNVTDRDEWTDQTEHPRRKLAVGLHVPAKHRPTLVHATREDAEREAARLACESKTGWADEYAVFELVAVVRGKVLAPTDLVKGMGTCKALVPKWNDSPGVEI
jgi:hypothetical protein